MTGLPPEMRKIAQVFQFPVVYDTMTVYDNLAFPLRNRGVDEATVNKRVHEVAEMNDLTATLNNRASQADRRRQAEDLPGPRPGAHRRQRHPVR